MSDNLMISAFLEGLTAIWAVLNSESFLPFTTMHFLVKSLLAYMTIIIAIFEACHACDQVIMTFMI
jgi:hypothetical protein